jgi:hypothetical protein
VFDINPTEIRYIKLGPGGIWASTAFDRGELLFGYDAVSHELCQARDWEAIREHLTQNRRSRGKAADALREIRDFYTLNDNCLWITFAQGHLWWTFANSEVQWREEATNASCHRVRRTLHGWSNVNLQGAPLRIDTLSSKLTQVAAYRQTICSVAPRDYLLRRLNGHEEPVIQQARQLKEKMIKVTTTMIEGLHWADLETMVDLIFSRSGWRRSSQLGGTQADVDLILEQPSTGERAFVQIKSRATQKTLTDYLERFRSDGSYDRFFFVCHSPTFEAPKFDDKTLHVWSGPKLAEVAMESGLFDWLITRSM